MADVPEPAPAPTAGAPEHVAPDEVDGPGHPVPAGEGAGEKAEARESITEPAKVMRIGSMVKQLLEEVRSVSLDEASRERLAEVYERSVIELSEALSPDLQEELRMLALPFSDDEVPSEAEIRVAKAQLVGWLEGLFHGIQASLMAQQVAARQQLEEMRQLPERARAQRGGEQRPGTYL
jgi:hypothetical protein